MAGLKEFIDKLIYRKITCLVIHLAGGPLEKLAFEAHTFSISKGSLEITSSKEGNALEQLAELDLPKNHPWIVTVYGRGVVYQLVSSHSSPTNSFATVLNERLPAVKAADFAGQLSGGERQLYSFARLDVLQKLLEYLSVAHRLKVQSLLFGFSALPAALPLLSLPTEPTDMHLADQRLTFSNGKLIDLSPASEPFTNDRFQLDGKFYTDQQLLALATVIPVVTNRPLSEWNLTGLTDSNASAYRTRWLAKTAGLVGLVLLLVTVFINSIVYTSMHRKQETLDYQQLRFSSQLSLLDSLSVQLENRRKLLGADAGGSRTFSSFYADRIAASLPPEILLTELAISPLVATDRSARKTEPPQFARNLIVVKGQCADGSPISQWITKLSAEPWVKQASIKNNQFPDFVVEIYVQSSF